MKEDSGIFGGDFQRNSREVGQEEKDLAKRLICCGVRVISLGLFDRCVGRMIFIEVMSTKSGPRAFQGGQVCLGVDSSTTFEILGCQMSMGFNYRVPFSYKLS